MTRRARRAVAALALLPCVAAPGHARAAGASAVEVRDLARRAPEDRDALRRLRAVDRVDGRAVRLGRALGGVRGPVLAARLRVLAADGAPLRPVDAAAARRDARAILAQARFRPAPVPRPFREPLERAAAALRAAAGWLSERVPGGGRTVWAALGAAAVGLALLVGARVARRRARGAAAARAPAVPRGQTADELERAADDAARRGQAAEALRLRFRAGLLRLDAAGAIRLRPSLTAGEVARGLGSPTFDRLARDFDEVAYGGRPADESRLEAARVGWPRVLAEASRR